MLNLAKITTPEEVAKLQRTARQAHWLYQITPKDHDAIDLAMVREISFRMNLRINTAKIILIFYFNLCEDVKINIQEAVVYQSVTISYREETLELSLLATSKLSCSSIVLDFYIFQKH